MQREETHEVATDECAQCRLDIAFQSWDGAGYAWHHVQPGMDVGHDAIPMHLGLRSITDRYAKGER